MMARIITASTSAGEPQALASENDFRGGALGDERRVNGLISLAPQSRNIK
jgi:hypothetical protein